MKITADLHIHSHFSRATSRNLTFEHLARWAQLKGIHVVGTGDLAHPGWLQEMRECLEPAEEGLYRLKPEPAAAVQAQVPPACQAPVRFLLSGEISNIYKRDGQTRKNHNMVFMPGFEAAERFQARLEKIGNIRADGRPILGLDARLLLEIVLETDPGGYLIPAHIWTPWFSALGSKSGFDSMDACFGDLTPHIFAVETGLSSDPPMNWRVSSLDRFVLVSNSDAHSPEKLGREATLFDTELAYPPLFEAMRSGDPVRFGGTIEFFPEEGKYHFDGHRDCGIAWDPETTLAHRGICPVCGKGVTVGVMNRVAALADRPIGGKPGRTHPFASLVPLPELLSEVLGVGPASGQVTAEYYRLLGKLGPELAILREVPVAEIAAAGGSRLAEGIERMRRGEVQATPGFDGEYGKIRVLPAMPQVGLFGGETNGATRRGAAAPTPAPAMPPAIVTDTPPSAVENRIAEAPLYQATLFDLEAATPAPPAPEALLAGLNPEQAAAAQDTAGPLVIIAGPGTGKTRTLTVRIAYLIRGRAVAPESILAITFTNKAAEEMAARLAALLGAETAGRIVVSTFHAFGARLLRAYAGQAGLRPDFALLDEEGCRATVRAALPDLSDAAARDLLERISQAKGRLLQPESPELEPLAAEADLAGLRAGFRIYNEALADAGALDFDDLIGRTVALLDNEPAVLAEVRARYRWISVDEYQDVNLAQHRLLQLLAGGEPPANLCVIGDPDQAIYGFRGADRRYFLSFENDFPGSRTRYLSQNYRSTQAILDAAAQVLAAGGERDREPLAAAAETLADFAEQVKLTTQRAATDRAEAEYVVHQIEQMVGGTGYFSVDSGRAAGNTTAGAASFGDFAVLFRLTGQARLLVEAFDRSGIPYQAVGQTPLRDRPFVRTVLAYLWLLRSPASAAHLQTVLAAGKPAFGEAAAAQVSAIAAARDDGLSAGLLAAAETGRFTPAQRARLRDLAAGFTALAAQAGQPVARLAEAAAALAQAQSGAPDGAYGAQGEHADLARRLALAAAPYGARLDAFLDALALQRETDVYDPAADRVALLTLHAAKGLEFPTVFIVGCEEGLIPYERGGKVDDEDEERRLFYVGMTRARRRLVLASAANRTLYGQRVSRPVSRFVGEIAEALRETEAVQHRAKKPEGKQLTLF